MSSTPLTGKRSRTPQSRPSTHPLSRSTTGRAGSSSRPMSRAPSRRARTATKHSDEVIVAIIENNLSEVGLCAYNLNGFDIELRQLSDSKTFKLLLTTLIVFDVVEIIMSLSSSTGPMDNALNEHSYTRDIKRTYISRSYFQDTAGAADVEKFSVKRCPHLMQLTSSPYYLALASCGALLKYIQHANNMAFVPRSLRITFNPNEDRLFLDMQTIEGLELLRNGRLVEQSATQHVQGSLFHVLNKTKTRAGRRLLRRSLLEPPTKLTNIKNRQDAIEEFSQNEAIYFEVIRVLTRFPDIEHALGVLTASQKRNASRAGQRNQTATSAASSGSVNRIVDSKVVNETKKPCISIIRAVLTIKAGLESADQLRCALKNASSPLLLMASNTVRVSALGHLSDTITEVIDEAARTSRDLETMRLHSAFAIKCGLNAQLDVSRQILCDIMRSMSEMRDELAEQYELRELKLALSASRGYHLTHPVKALDDSRIPRVFIKRQITYNLRRFTTIDLGNLNTRYFDVLNEIWLLTDSELRDLLEVIFEPITALALYYLCDSVAIIDLTSSFVTYTSTSCVKHTRPLMTRDGPTVIARKAHHPILASIDSSASIPNRMQLDVAAALLIITGQNDSGKSTTIKMIGLLVIMGHAGCNVPCDNATFRVMDCILSRFTTDDDITDGHSHSHFSKEMSEMAAILNSIKVNNEGELEPARPKTSSSTQTIPWDPNESHIDGEKQFLLLIDELGRSTATLDGFSIAYGMLEEFASTPGVFTLFATHFLGLSALEKVYPNVGSYHMETREPPTAEACRSSTPTAGSLSVGNSRTTTPSSVRAPIVESQYTYKLKEGVLNKRSYGIETAHAAGFPVKVVEDATGLTENMSLRRITDPEAFAAAHCSQEDMDRARKGKGSLFVVRRIGHIKALCKDEKTRRRRLHRFQQEVIAVMNQEQFSSTQGPSSQNPPDSGCSADDTSRLNH